MMIYFLLGQKADVSLHNIQHRTAQDEVPHADAMTMLISFRLKEQTTWTL